MKMCQINSFNFALVLSLWYHLSL